MPKVGAFHSMKEKTPNVHHDNSKCTEGRRLERLYLNFGTAGRPLCAHCERLGEQEREPR